MTLDARETLKGKRAEVVVLTIRRPRGEDMLPRWKESRQSLLWFLARKDPGREAGTEEEEPAPAPQEWDVRGGAVPGSLALELGTRATGKRVPVPIFSMDLSLLDREEQILAAVRADASYRQNWRLARWQYVYVPRDVMERTGRSGDANARVVPVDGRLERLTHRWLRSNDPWLREAGVEALKDFKSGPNITLLKRLLRDGASYVQLSDGTADTSPRAERVFYMREVAYRMLTGWGVAVPRPVLRVILEEGDPEASP